MSAKSLMWGVAAGTVALGVLWLVVGGRQEEAVAIAPVSSALAPSTASLKSIRYTIDSKGKTSISMPAPKEHIKAITEQSGGFLDVDLTNISNARGEVKVDLTTLSTHTFGNDDDASQTKHALTWLEVSDASPAEERGTNRWVVYAIRGIENASASDVTSVSATKEGDEEVRTVTLTAKGDLLLHGHKVENREAQLEARLHYPLGAPAGSRPSLIEIKSKEPLRVILAEHDVKPRDTFGKFAKEGLGLLGTKVANTADVTIDLRATPSSK